MSTLPLQTGIGYTPGNIDLATQQAALDRKRQLLTYMLMQGMQPQGGTQMAGNIAIRNSALGPLAQMLRVYAGQQGISDVDKDERDLIAAKQQAAADATSDLMNAAQPQGGTPTTITEMPGPMPDGQSPNLVTQAGTPAGFDQAAMAKAYAKAQYAGVDPSVLSTMLQQFNRGRMLTQMGYGNMVPGAQGGAPTFTPGDTTHGAQLSIPASAGGAQGGGGGAGFGGVPPQAAALMMSGDSALEKLGGAINEQSKPISGRAGAPMWGRDANGTIVMVGFSPQVEKGQTVDAQGRVSTAPGYLPSASEIQTQEEAIKAGLRPVTMKASDGTETQGYLAPGGQFTPFRQGGAQQPAAAPAAPAGMSDAQAHAYALAQDRAGKPVDMTSTGNGFVDRAAQPSAQGPSFNRSQSTQDKALAEGVGKNQADQILAIDNGATEAQGVQGRNQEMRAMVSQYKPGAGQPTRETLAKIADAFGLDDDTVNKIAGGNLSAMQAMGKSVVDNAFAETRAALGGTNQRIGQQEVLLKAQKGSVNGTLTMPAILAMLDYSNGLAQWKIEKQTYKDQWLAAGKPYNGFEGWFNRNHPLTSYIPSSQQLESTLAAPRNNASPQVPGALPGEIPGAAPVQTATNPKTGQRLMLKGGQWVPMQ